MAVISNGIFRIQDKWPRNSIPGPLCAAPVSVIVLVGSHFSNCATPFKLISDQRCQRWWMASCVELQWQPWGWVKGRPFFQSHPKHNLFRSLGVLFALPCRLAHPNFTAIVFNVSEKKCAGGQMRWSDSGFRVTLQSEARVPNLKINSVVVVVDRRRRRQWIEPHVFLVSNLLFISFSFSMLF